LNIGGLPGATNILNVTSGVLYPYCKSAQVYRCPGDQDIVHGSTGERVRDYSINGMLGNNLKGMTAHYNIQEHLTFASVINPNPSSATFFVEEQSSVDPSSTCINDWYFWVSPVLTADQQWGDDGPGSRHGNFGVFSYADGHVARMKWLDPYTQYMPYKIAPYSALENPDVRQIWLTTYASGSVPGMPG